MDCEGSVDSVGDSVEDSVDVDDVDSDRVRVRDRDREEEAPTVRDGEVKIT